MEAQLSQQLYTCFSSSDGVPKWLCDISKKKKKEAESWAEPLQMLQRATEADNVLLGFITGIVVTEPVLPPLGTSLAGSAGISCSRHPAVGLSCPSPAPDWLQMCLYTDVSKLLTAVPARFIYGLDCGSCQFVLRARFVSESWSVAGHNQNEKQLDEKVMQIDKTRNCVPIHLLCQLFRLFLSPWGFRLLFGGNFLRCYASSKEDGWIYDSI